MSIIHDELKRFHHWSQLHMGHPSCDHHFDVGVAVSLEEVRCEVHSL